MLVLLRQLSALPEFGSHQKNRQAAILNTIIGLTALYILSHILIDAGSPGTIKRFVALSVCFGMHRLLKRGHLWFITRAYVVLAVVMTVMTTVSETYVGMEPQAYFMAVMVVASLVIGAEAVLWTGFFASAFSAIFILAGGWQTGFASTAWSEAVGMGVNYAIYFLIITYLLYLGARSIESLLNKLTRMNVTLSDEVRMRTQTADALAQRELELNLTLENAPIGIVTFGLDGEMLRVNQALCEMLRCHESDLMALRIKALISAENQPSFQHHLNQLCQGAKFTEPLEQSLSTDCGIVRDTYWRVALIRDIDETPLHFVASIEDITERRKIQRQFQLAQKHEGLGILAGGIAHDFNNLLVAMMGQSSLVLERSRRNKPIEKNVQKMLKAADKAALLTKQLLAYAGKGQIEMSSLSLREVINDNLQLLSVALPSGVQLQVDHAPHLPTIEGDVGQLQQVAMNLIINAGEAMPLGGEITIRTQCVTLDEVALEPWQMTEHPLAPGAYVLLEVADDGTGMDSETRSRIFDPFFTTKETGHGLGLAAVLGIVRSHGGSLTVESALGVGTTFKLIFPIDSAEIISAEPAPQLANERPDLLLDTSTIGTVLVIDDEINVRETVQDMLELSGYQVLLADGGLSGIECYQTQQGTIDAVLLDLTMPGMSGEETLAHLRQIDPQARIIISSGHSQQQISTLFATQPHLDFLPKPYNYHDLTRMLAV